MLRQALWGDLAVAVILDGVGQMISIAMPFQFEAVIENASLNRMKEAYSALIFNELADRFLSYVSQKSGTFWDSFDEKTEQSLEIVIHDRMMELGWEFHSQGATKVLEI